MPKFAKRILKYAHGQKLFRTLFPIWAMFTKCSFDKEKNKLDYCTGRDCI